jgi:hypothetical protein
LRPAWATWRDPVSKTQSPMLINVILTLQEVPCLDSGTSSGPSDRALDFITPLGFISWQSRCCRAGSPIPHRERLSQIKSPPRSLQTWSPTHPANSLSCLIAPGRELSRWHTQLCSCKWSHSLPGWSEKNLLSHKTKRPASSGFWALDSSQGKWGTLFQPSWERV